MVSNQPQMEKPAHAALTCAASDVFRVGETRGVIRSTIAASSADNPSGTSTEKVCAKAIGASVTEAPLPIAVGSPATLARPPRVR